ncbi:hypothetical protein [Streptomyces lydicus]|uniref:hypothetical protein n=1 Tax=Streptomyces lydicus TaxID=47763 RepID=UPI0036E22DE4
MKLHARAFDHAKKLVKERQVVLDDRDEWSEHRPSAEEENRYLEQHGFAEYRKWYLGEDEPTAPRPTAFRPAPRFAPGQHRVVPHVGGCTVRLAADGPGLALSSAP